MVLNISGVSCGGQGGKFPLSVRRNFAICCVKLYIQSFDLAEQIEQLQGTLVYGDVSLDLMAFE